MFEKIFKKQLQEINNARESAIAAINDKRVDFDALYKFDSWHKVDTNYKKLVNQIQYDMSKWLHTSIDYHLEKEQIIRALVRRLNEMQLKKGK